MMAQEIEAKFRLPDTAALCRRLDALGAQRSDAVRETNLILDTPERRLLSAGCGLRVRTAGPPDGAGPRRTTLTYKGPRDPVLQASGIKAREEIELAVSDQRDLLTILARLGFVPVLCYEKQRETWHLGSAEVVLDRLPQLGSFVEIEAPDAGTIESVRTNLGLDQAAAVPETYPELTARHGTPNAAGCRVLRFEPVIDGAP